MLRPPFILRPPFPGKPFQWLCHTSGFWTLQTLHGRFRRSKTSHLLDCGRWALRDCGRSCADCGLGALARQIFFSSGPKLKPLKPLEPCQWFCHTGRWSSQLLDSGRFRRSKTSHLPDCGLWALRDCGRSCAGCARGSGAPNPFFLVARNCPSNASNPSNASTLAMVVPYVWILDASDAPWTLQTLQNLALARLWALGSVPDCGPYWPLEQPASGFWTLQTLQNLALARLWALGSARLWAELRRLWARGSGAPNPFFLVARNCPSNASNPSNPSNPSDTCQWLCPETPRTPRTLPMVLPYWPLEQPASGFWTLQTLQNLALARLWALGSARLWAELRRLWARGSGAPNPFFLVARNCPSNASNPSNASTLAMVAPYVWILDASDAPWTLQTLQNFALARLWALGSVPDCGPYWPLEQPASGFWTLQTLQNLALARLWALGSARLWAELRRLWARGSGAPNPFFLVARNCPSNASNPSNPSNASTLANGCAIRLDSGRFRRSMDASDAPKPRTC